MSVPTSTFTATFNRQCDLDAAIKSTLSQIKPDNLLTFLLSLVLFFFPTIATAQTIISDGSTNSNVTSQGNRLNITGGDLSQDGNNLFHSFSQFGLTSNQTANFLSNPSIKNILSRITSGSPSVINGLIKVTGGNSNLFLLNPSGIIFGSNARLDVPASLTATTATSIGIGNAWFNATGNNNYAQLNGTPSSFIFSTNQPLGTIINQGQLVVGEGQNLTLLGGSVVNSGNLTAAGGNIILAAVSEGNYVRLSQPGHLLSLEIQPISGQDASLIDNISTLSLPQLLTGTSKAGEVTVSGTVDVSSLQGGNVQVFGNKVAILDAKINASGNSGGGLVLIGGDYQGHGTAPTAFSTNVAQNSIITADANVNGKGGRVIIWADDTTHFFGKISVRGGTIGGDGGFVEVSGKNFLDYRGKVDALAPFGKVGTLLLDPTNIEIVAAANANTSNLNDAINAAAPDLPGGTRLSVDVLNNAAANIILQASNDIIFSVPVNITNQGVGLAADAGNNITANQNITTNGGDVTLVAGRNIITNTITTSASPLGDPPLNRSGAVNLTAGGNITTGTIDTSFIGLSGDGSQGGSVVLNAVGNLTTEAIDASSNNFSRFSNGNTTSSGGLVDLAGRNISFDSINNSGAANVVGMSGIGGDVQILARGVVQGTGTVNNLTPIPILNIPANTTIFSRGTTQGGAITIQHNGRPNNDAFSVGGLASGNGLVGAINTNSGIISIGVFPVLANNGTATGTPSGISINSVNTPPRLTANSQLADVQQGQPLTFTYADLQVLVNDVNSDRSRDSTTVFIDTVTVGALTRNGVPVVGNTTISPGDVLVYTPPSNIIGQISAFTIRASDRVSVSLPRAITFNVIQTPTPLTPTPIPSSSPTPSPIPIPKNPLPEQPQLPRFEITGELPPLKIDLIVGQIEYNFTRQFEQYFGQSSPTPLKTLDEGREILNQVEKAIGIKPALIYVAFLPQTITSSTTTQPQDSDQLELVVVTAKNPPIRKRLKATREQVLKVAQEYRKQVTDVRSVKGYLAPSQQLYQWLVAPLEGDLQARSIQNLVFIMDSGLRSIPIAALHDGKSFLIERYSVGLMPSLSLSDTRYKDIKDAKILAMGSATFAEQKPLPAVPTEIETISQRLWQGKSFLNDAFTLENLKQARQQQPFGIIHLATHGEFKSGSPANSYIQLWDSKLRLDQMRQLGWNNPPVELLVLSACRTALGDEQAELGFAGLGILAGVKSALASLWYVSDEGTLALMTDFYSELNSAPIKAEALRQAQLAMIKGQVLIKDGKLITPKTEISLPSELALQNQTLQHPYYWAAFTMIGNPW